MVRSKRLTPIKTIADNKESKAAQSFSLANQALQTGRERLLQLESYRIEYVETMQHQACRGMSGAHLQQYHQFLSKIDEAITQQKTLIVDLEMAFVRSRSHWRDERSRSQAIGKAIEKIKQQEQKTADKRDVAKADEMSTQAYVRRHCLEVSKS